MWSDLLHFHLADWMLTREVKFRSGYKPYVTRYAEHAEYTEYIGHAEDTEH